MRAECSDLKLFLGMALMPLEGAKPLSATSAMTWPLRSMAQGLRASDAQRGAGWVDGATAYGSSVRKSGITGVAQALRAGPVAFDHSLACSAI